MSKQNKTKQKRNCFPLPSPPRSSVGQSHRLPLAALRGFALFFFFFKGRDLASIPASVSLAVPASRQASERASEQPSPHAAQDSQPAQPAGPSGVSVCLSVCVCLSVSVCLSVYLFVCPGGRGGEGREGVLGEEAHRGG